MLRQKSIKRNGMIRYCNKLACKHCKNKCTTADFKEVDFNKDKLIILARGYKPQASDDIGDGRPTLRGRRELLPVKRLCQGNSRDGFVLSLVQYASCH